MSFDTLGQLNWLAVLAGALIYFVLGALWYSPALFARPWQRAIGWDESRPQPQSNVMTYVAPLLAYIVAAIATGMIAKATGTDTFGEGIVLGLVTGVGYALVMTAIEAVFDPNKPGAMTWFVITGAYHLIGFVIMAVVVSIWV
jgi:hypothetical protein